MRLEAAASRGSPDRLSRPAPAGRATHPPAPTRTDEAIERRVIEERKQWGFGSKKILRRLQDEQPEVAWPPRSTIDAIFKRAGLTQRRRKILRRFAPVKAQRTYQSD